VPVVEDGAGYRYHRSTEQGYWYNDDDAPVRGTYQWADLLWARGPVTADVND
jgi:hypothetical protein